MSYEHHWHNKFEELKAYRKKHNTCNVPRSHSSLGIWVGTQRAYRKTGKLTQDRIDKLESIGFIWDISEYLWLEKIEMLKKYKKKHKHCYVRQKEKTLGSWVNMQRRLYYKGELSQEKIEQLDSIGFVWDIEAYRWNSKIELLKAYKKKHRHCNVERKEGSLGKWVILQRVLYEHRALEEERIQELNSIGFIWNVEEHQWLEKFKLLKEYKKKHKNCNVSRKDGELGEWVYRQRILYYQGKMPQDKIEKLNEIDFVWQLRW